MARHLRWRVHRVVDETDQARSFELEPLDGPVTYRAGQFLTLRVPSERTGHVARSYSFSSAPETDLRPRVTVKRVLGGYASHWLCDHLDEGDEITTLVPAGVFTLDDASLESDLLLVAAGSGVTPVLSLAKRALAAGTGHVQVVYANRDASSVIHAAELLDLQAAHPERLGVVHWLEELQGVPGAAWHGLLAPWARRRSWICGPQAFMDVVVAQLTALGADPAHVVTERFVSLTGDPFADVTEPAREGPADEIDVTLDGAHHQLPWPAGQALLDVLLDAGLDAPYSCREGACSACAYVLLEGEVEMENNEVLDSTDLADGIRLSCQSRAASPRVSITFDA